MAPAHKNNETEPALVALAKVSARIKRLEQQIKRERRLRHTLMHSAATMTDGAGGRRYSNYRIAQAANISSQAVDQALAKPVQPEVIDE